MATNNTVDAAALLAALRFAAYKHRGQRRKDVDETPYINHPIAVAELLVRVGGIADLVTLQGAVLHDTIEDTQTTPQELGELFGQEVQQLVMEVTDDKSLPKQERKQLQIKHAPHLSMRAKQIKIADKICNVADITTTQPVDWPLQRKREYLDWAEKVVAGCRGCCLPLEQYFDVVLKERRQRLNTETEAKTTEESLYEALTALAHRGVKGSWVRIEDPSGSKFVQIGTGRSLGMDVPCVALTAGEANRASAFYQQLGELYSREYHAPNPKTGRIHFGATFYHDFGNDTRAAAKAAIAFFEEVYLLPRGTSLSIIEH